MLKNIFGIFSGKLFFNLIQYKLGICLKIEKYYSDWFNQIPRSHNFQFCIYILKNPNQN